MAGNIYSKNPDVVFRQIADEFILVPIRQKVVDLKSIYTLNEIAAFIWQQIDGKNDFQAIRQRLLDAFEADPAQATGDLEEIFLQWASLGLIQSS
ncbi:MAG: PqqD family protein [Candidatus Omnitrophica bacterium]|nr:PqqD family protein [Candidatus Omnitrophota bacterium]